MPFYINRIEVTKINWIWVEITAWQVIKRNMKEVKYSL